MSHVDRSESDNDVVGGNLGRRTRPLRCFDRPELLSEAAIEKVNFRNH